MNRIGQAAGLAFAVCGSIAAQSLQAREDGLGPPPALERPMEAGGSAPLGLSLGAVRFAVERSADNELCLMLMRHDNVKNPPDAAMPQTCLPAYAVKVAANQGLHPLGR